MKNLLLIGFGSEIGSMLIYLNNPKKDRIYISTVITRLINPTVEESLNSLKARLIILNPSLINSIKTDNKKKVCSLLIIEKLRLFGLIVII